MQFGTSTSLPTLQTFTESEQVPHGSNTDAASASGYASRRYAESLAEFGTPRALSACGGWLLEQSILNTPFHDGTGCYPLFTCREWNLLRNDLETLSSDLVSVRLVTDPCATVDPSQLVAAFPDLCREFKQHYLTDLSLPLERIVCPHHRRNVRKALRTIETSESTGDPNLLPHWRPLYDQLVRRHGITGVARFSPTAFARQLNVPGLTAFTATENNGTCGITLWYVQGHTAYYHLAAYNDRGYERGASFALFWHALSHFARCGVRWAALGAGAGTSAAESGLTRFKRGWATHTRPTFLCGRILQPDIYAALAGAATNAADFFPAYRAA